MIKWFLSLSMLFLISLTVLASVPTEEPLTREQFGVIGEVHTVVVEIKSLGQQVFSSEIIELVFDEDGYIVSQQVGDVLATYYYDAERRLVRKVFTYQERILQTISIEYAEKSYTAISYDDKNKETGSTVYTYDLEQRTLSFTNTLENGRSDNLMVFDQKGRNVRTTSYIVERVEESNTTINMVVEMNNVYNEAGQLNGRTMILRIRNEGQERSVETSTRVDRLLTDEWGNVTREIQRTEYSDGSNPAEEYIYSRLFTYF